MVKLYAFKLLSVRRHRDWIPTNITILYFRASCRIRTNDLLIARVGKNRTFIFPNYRVQFKQFYSVIQVSCTTAVLRRQFKIIYIEILASRIKVTRCLKPYLASLLDKSVCIYLGYILPNILNLFSNLNI